MIARPKPIDELALDERIAEQARRIRECWTPKELGKRDQTPTGYQAWRIHEVAVGKLEDYAAGMVERAVRFVEAKSA